MWYAPDLTLPASAVEPISVPVSEQVRVLAPDRGFDADLDHLIKSSRAHVERYCDVLFVSRAVVARGDGWADLARLPVAPVTAVTSISYVDAGGADQTVDPSVYEARLDGLEGAVVLKPGQVWPGRAAGSRITLTVVAGYATPPYDVMRAMRLLIARDFDTREVVAKTGWTQFDDYLCNHRRHF